MAFSFHSSPFFGHAAVLVDDECAAFDPFNHFAIHVFVFYDAKSVAQLFVFVRKQIDRVTLFFFEFFVFIIYLST